MLDELTPEQWAWGGPSTKTLLWKSEPAALLAAILAAPEAA